MTIADVRICESISDPDTFDWTCPNCFFGNDYPFLTPECAGCGYEIDPEKFDEALQLRRMWEVRRETT